MGSSRLDAPHTAASGEGSRVVVWFSCGAASAVAASLAVGDYGKERVEVVYCDVLADEHPDNARFLDDMQSRLGIFVRIVGSYLYDTVDEVFEQTRYMAGVSGARCTTEMKKLPRREFQRPDDIHIFGFTADEQNRIATFEANNPELHLDWILLRHNFTKKDCYTLLEERDIKLPAMYELGYKNNNCLGCVKATSARYWNMVRRDFPDVFEARAKRSRELGVRLTRYKGERVFLDELPEDYLPAEPLEDISCGPDCSVDLPETAAPTPITTITTSSTASGA